ncbi:MAG: molybdenum cofactor guanylyltransferase [Rhodospirillales bacterium]|nr:molybdenum cofactor guanylyltransferase [Rhodospirillales bacterium]
MTRASITGLILAGGRGRRFGGTDKAFIDLAGKPLIGHVIARIAPQVDRIIINSNSNPSRFATFDCPVIADDPTQGCSGVFAALAAACPWMTAATTAEGLLLTAPTDTPFLPLNLADLLAKALAAGTATVAYATSGGVSHPTIALWSRVPLTALIQRAQAGEVARLRTLLPMVGGVPVAFPIDEADPFFNVNTPDDRAAAAALIAASTASRQFE